MRVFKIAVISLLSSLILALAAAVTFILFTEGGAAIALRIAAHHFLSGSAAIESVRGSLSSEVLFQGLRFDREFAQREMQVSIGRGGVEALPFLFGEGVKASLRDVRLDAAGGWGPLSVGAVEGGSDRGWVFQDVQLESPPRAPEGTKVTVQRLEFGHPPQLSTLRAVHNAKALIPGADPVLMDLRSNAGELKGWIYTSAVYIAQALPLWGWTGAPVEGMIKDANLEISGTQEEVQLRGPAHVERLQFKAIAVEDAPVAAQLILRPQGRGYRITGNLLVEGGRLRAANSVLDLEPSKITLPKDGGPAVFDVIGSTRIDGLTITASLKGNLAKPTIRLRSDPSKPEGYLMMVLATGKRWRGTEAAYVQGQLSTDVAREFVQYWLLGGMGDRLAKMLGVDALLFHGDPTQQGLGVQKNIQSLGFRYGYERATEPATREQSQTHRIGAEIYLPGESSVEVEAGRTLPQGTIDDLQSGTSPQPEDEWSVRYKRRF